MNLLDFLFGRQRPGYRQQPPAPFLPYRQFQQPPMPPYQQAQQPQHVQREVPGAFAVPPQQPQQPMPPRQAKIPKKPRPQPQQFQQPQYVQQEAPQQPDSIDIRQAAVEVLIKAGKLKLVCLIAIIALILSSFIAVIDSMVGVAIALCATGVVAYFMVMNEKESKHLREKYGV